jgi:hypothetical protein
MPARYDRKAAQRFAAALGVTLEKVTECRYPEITATAPDGFRFAIEGLHQFVTGGCVPGDRIGPMWADMAERLAGATLEPCPSDCECRESWQDG